MIEEIQDAIRARRKHTDFGMDLIKISAGSKYRKDWIPSLDVQENHCHEWVTNMLPNLVDGNPVLAGIKSGALEDDHPALSDLTKAVNAWAQSNQIQHVLTEMALDMQYNFAAGLVSLERDPLMNGGDEIYFDQSVRQMGALRPRLHRISPYRLFCDQQAVNRLGRRYMGHIWIEDKKSLEDRKLPNGKAMFDPAALRAVTVDDDVRTLLAEMGVDVGVNGKDRDQVVGYEFYVPETGLIYTLATTTTGSGKGVYLCEPRKYNGLKTGPYVMGGINIVPDQTYPLPPLAVVHDLIKEINLHQGQVSDDAGQAKRLMIVDADPQALGKAQMALNGALLGIPGFKGAATEVKTGGASPDQIAYIELLSGRLDKMLGLTDASSGETTGATAEEVATVQQNRNVRVKWAQKSFRNFTAGLLRIVAESFWNNPRTRQAINHEDPSTGEKTFGIYEGGDGQKLGIPFEDLTLTIDPYSMAPQDDALKTRYQIEGMNLIVANMEAMKSNPQVRWKQMIGDFFEALGQKGRGERYIDWEMMKRAQVLTVPALFADPSLLVGAAGGAEGMEGQGVTPGPASAPSNVAGRAAERGSSLKLTG